MKKMKVVAAFAAVALSLSFFACKNNVSTDDDYEDPNANTGLENPDAGSEKPNASSDDKKNQTSYVTARATSEGLEFSGTIVSNVFSDANSNSYLESFYPGYNEDGNGGYVSGNVHTSTSVTNKTKATIEVKDCDSGVIMKYEFEKGTGGYEFWNLTYPLVEKGKTYSMQVSASWDGWTFYTEYFEITAEGGLGEYVVTNVDTSIPELTSDRVIKKKVAPTFTQNPNVKIISQGTHYEIYRIDDTSDWLAWVYEVDILSDNSTTGYPLKEVYARSYWKTYDDINAMLSGWSYRVQARTLLKIAGYSKATFWMNDTESARGSWGGSKAKTLVVYGVRDNYGNILTKKEDFDRTGINVTNLPGSSHSMPIDGETRTFPYSQEVDYGTTISEPRTVPVVSGAGISGVRFTGWNVEFPRNASGTISSTYWDSEKNGPKAQFDLYTVIFAMFDGQLYYEDVTGNGDSAAGSDGAGDSVLNEASGKNL